MGSTAYLALSILARIFWPSQGWTDALVYFRPRYIRWRTTCPMDGRWFAIQQTVFSVKKASNSESAHPRPPTRTTQNSTNYSAILRRASNDFNPGARRSSNEFDCSTVTRRTSDLEFSSSIARRATNEFDYSAGTRGVSTNLDSSSAPASRVTSDNDLEMDPSPLIEPNREAVAELDQSLAPSTVARRPSNGLDYSLSSRRSSLVKDIESPSSITPTTTMESDDAF